MTTLQVSKVICTLSTPQSPSTALKPTFNLPTHYKRCVGSKTGNSVREVAQIKTLPLELPQNEHVLVKVEYAGVNGGCETFRARGEHLFARNKQLKEYNLGAECVGTVVACGDEVSSLQAGDLVTTASANSFSEYVNLDAKLCTAVWECTPQMTAVALSGFFAWGSLEQVGQIKKNDVVLVTAAGGALGSFAVQMSMLHGCRTIGICGSQQKQELLEKSLGVNRVINYRNQDVDDILRNEYPQGVDLILEGVGGELRDTVVQHLAPGGRMVCPGYISQYPHNSNAKQAYQSKHGLLAAEKLLWERQNVELNQGRRIIGEMSMNFVDAKKQVLEWYRNGQLEAVVDQTRTFVGIESIVDAVDYMLTGNAVGKVVVKIS